MHAPGEPIMKPRIPRPLTHDQSLIFTIYATVNGSGSVAILANYGKTARVQDRLSNDDAKLKPRSLSVSLLSRSLIARSPDCSVLLLLLRLSLQLPFSGCICHPFCDEWQRREQQQDLFIHHQVASSNDYYSRGSSSQPQLLQPLYGSFSFQCSKTEGRTVSIEIAMEAPGKPPFIQATRLCKLIINRRYRRPSDGRSGLRQIPCSFNIDPSRQTI